MFTEQLTQALSLAANPTHAAAQTASFNSNSVDLSKFANEWRKRRQTADRDARLLLESRSRAS